jgi:hypothetical protein
MASCEKGKRTLGIFELPASLDLKRRGTSRTSVSCDRVMAHEMILLIVQGQSVLYRNKTAQLQTLAQIIHSLT